MEGLIDRVKRFICGDNDEDKDKIESNIPKNTLLVYENKYEVENRKNDTDYSKIELVFNILHPVVTYATIILLLIFSFKPSFMHLSIIVPILLLVMVAIDYVDSALQNFEYNVENYIPSYGVYITTIALAIAVTLATPTFFSWHLLGYENSVYTPSDDVELIILEDISKQLNESEITAVSRSGSIQTSTVVLDGFVNKNSSGISYDRTLFNKSSSPSPGLRKASYGTIEINLSDFQYDNLSDMDDKDCPRFDIYSKNRIMGATYFHHRDNVTVKIYPSDERIRNMSYTDSNTPKCIIVD